MPLVLGLISLVLIFPLAISTTGDSHQATDAANAYAARKFERIAIYSALQRALADLAISGGAEQVQQDFPEIGVSVYTLSQLETITGQETQMVRLWSTARPLGTEVTNSPGNWNLTATVTYDPVTGIVSTIHFIEL